MQVVGIVSEFNPFHSGHRYLFEQLRSEFSDCGIVCVMSGNVVQRGSLAVFGKHTRASAAVLCGADLVIELPAPWALSSAEGFARGAVGLLDSCGVVTHIGFGSETGELDGLRRVAELLLRPETAEEIKRRMEGGAPYAAARQRAVSATLGDNAKLLGQPNNILAVEYLKALASLSSAIEPFAVKRRGAEHDADEDSEHLSASRLRDMLDELDINGLERHIPAPAMELFYREINAGRAPVFINDCERAVLARLRALGEEDFAALPDASEGLHLRLMRYARSCTSIDEILEKTKTKRYAYTRVRRMLLCAYLGITAGDRTELPPYIRLLAMNGRGRELAREISKNGTLPLLTKPAHTKKLNEGARRIFELEASVTDSYVLAYPDISNAAGGQEWTNGPVIIG